MGIKFITSEILVFVLLRTGDVCERNCLLMAMVLDSDVQELSAR